MAVPERCACGVHGSNGFHLLDCPDYPRNLKAEVERLREDLEAAQTGAKMYRDLCVSRGAEVERLRVERERTQEHIRAAWHYLWGLDPEVDEALVHLKEAFPGVENDPNA
jgi:hypothetical protein